MLEIFDHYAEESPLSFTQQNAASVGKRKVLRTCKVDIKDSQGLFDQATSYEQSSHLDNIHMMNNTSSTSSLHWIKSRRRLRQE